MTDSRDDFDDARPLPNWDRRGDVPLWRDEGGHTVFDNDWIRLTRHRAIAPTGARADYVVMRPEALAVGVLPVHEDGTVTLVGQTRFALMNLSWEMPEGGAPFDEPPLDGAKRELAEEAGLKADDWLEVLRLELSNSLSDERAIAWIAWNLSSTEKAPDPTEAIVCARVPFREVLHAVEGGAVRDAFTVATVLRVYQMTRDGRLPDELARSVLAGL